MNSQGSVHSKIVVLAIIPRSQNADIQKDNSQGSSLISKQYTNVFWLSTSYIHFSGEGTVILKNHSCTSSQQEPIASLDKYIIPSSEFATDRPLPISSTLSRLTQLLPLWQSHKQGHKMVIWRLLHLKGAHQGTT